MAFSAHGSAIITGVMSCLRQDYAALACMCLAANVNRCEGVKSLGCRLIKAFIVLISLCVELCLFGVLTLCQASARLNGGFGKKKITRNLASFPGLRNYRSSNRYNCFPDFFLLLHSVEC